MKVLWPTCLLLCGLSLAASAGDLAPLARLVAAAPAVEAARLRSEAAREKEGSVGRLPDPNVEAMGAQKSTPTDDNPMWGLALQQPLPRAGERTAARNRAIAEAEMAEAEWAIMAGDLATDIAMRLAEAEAARQRHALLAAQVAKAEQARVAFQTRVSTGQAPGAERLALDMRIADMHLMMEKELQMATDAEQAARAALALPAEAALPGFAAPVGADLSPEHAPALRLAAAQERESTAMAAMARAEARPMTAVGVRFDREEMEDGNEDTVSVTFMSDLPWHARRVSRADLRAAHAGVEASRLSRSSVSNELAALLGRVDRAQAFAGRTRKLVGENQARLDAEYAALVGNAAATGKMGGASSALMLLEILERSTDLQRQQVDAEAAEKIAQAELWRFVAPATFGDQP